MIRSPHRTLAQIDTSTAVLDRATRQPNRRPSGLERIATGTGRRNALSQSRLGELPRRQEVVLQMPAVSHGLRTIDVARPRVRSATAVPSLAAQRRFPIAPLDLSRKDVTLPYGIERYVNAATLKAMAGGRPFDRLLKRTPGGWQFVPDATRIDLTDDRQEFRLGKLTIFS